MTDMSEIPKNFSSRKFENRPFGTIFKLSEAPRKPPGPPCTPPPPHSLDYYHDKARNDIPHFRN